jgi:thioredoxin 1
MPFDPLYREHLLTRQELAGIEGPVLLEFGANWCGICQSFAPRLKQLLQEYPEVQHIKVEDGKGKPLGRSFRVTLWPTLVFLRNGQVVHQVARPTSQQARDGLTAITANEDKPDSHV